MDSHPPLNTQRHEQIFSPRQFADAGIDVHVIGCGALGSRIGRHLAQLGVSAHLYDDDTVSSHNVANQAFGLGDVGKFKVDALRERQLSDTGVELVAHCERLSGTETLFGVVFVCVDSMTARKAIWERMAKLSVRVQLLIESRMGAENGRIYLVNPRRPAHIKEYEATLHSDEEASDYQAPACGAQISVGPTAEGIAACAVWQFIRWFRLEHSAVEDVLDNEIILSFYPQAVFSRRFE